MNVPISIQPSTTDIAPLAADLLYLTMGHSADYLFGGDDPVAARRTLERLFRAPSNLFSYQYTDTIALSSKTAGLVLAYPGKTLSALELPTAWRLLQAVGFAAFVHFLWRVPPFADIKEAEDDEFFISNLAVLPECQGQGLGTAMLAACDRKARALGFTKVSLTVDVENARAFALYQRTGFKVVSSVQIEPLRRRFGYQGLHRMVKELD